MQRSMQRNAVYEIAFIFITEKYCEKVPKKSKKNGYKAGFILWVKISTQADTLISQSFFF